MSYSVQNIRNVCLLGHSGSGKTSLAESLLFMTGAIDRMGRVADGNTVCDYDPEEVKRQISLSTAVAPIDYKGCRINVLDTPGAFDFSGEVMEALRAADAAIIVASAKDGVSVGVEKAWKYCEERNMPRFIYISKIDEDHSDYNATFDALRERFGNKIAPVVVPTLDENKKVTGLMDILNKRAYEMQDGKRVEIELPEDKVAVINEFNDALKESVAETSEDFMERFFKLIPLKAVSGEGDRPSELRLLGEEENMTSDFVGISDEDKATFNADMLLLTDVVNQSRTNDNTALLLNLDKRRDPLVSFIINTTSIGRKSSNPAYAQACISLYNILKPYRGIQNIPMQQETAQIKGMLYDLDKPENKQKITLLHLDDTVSELRNVNDEFDALSSDRTNERAINAVGTAKEIRHRLNSQYDYITTTIFAHSIAVPSDEATLFITQLNQLIDETRTAYNLRKGITASNKNKGQGGNDERPGEL